MFKTENERAALERAVAGYYASLTDAETTELAHWNEFAGKELPPEDSAWVVGIW